MTEIIKMNNKIQIRKCGGIGGKGCGRGGVFFGGEAEFC